MQAVLLKDYDLLHIQRETALSTFPAICLWQHHFSEEQLAALLPDNVRSETDDIFSCQSAKRRIERLSVRLMLLRLLGPEARLRYLPTGRPVLDTGGPEISISHTQGVYALSLAARRHGIDVETLSPKALRVADKYLQPAETELLHSQTLPAEHTLRPLDAERRATLLWSAKEAVYKHFDIPGLELKDDILLMPGHGGALQARLPRQGMTARVHCQTFSGFVLTCCTDAAD